MMEIFFGLLLLASMALNGLLIWYIRGVMSKSSVVYNATTDMLGALQDFVAHLESINELRAYYGDPEFRNVVDHAKFITEEISEYSNGFIFEMKGGRLEHSYSAKENSSQEE